MIRELSTALVLCLVPIAAAAQIDGAATADPAAQTPQGPMIVERVHNGFLASPDFKVTQVERKSSGLAGGYAGVVFADAFFVGAGAYALVTNTRNREMVYGGMILQWFGRANERLGYSAKVLIGGGTAESSGTVQVMDRGRVISQPVRSRQDFAVVEPEVSALIRFTKHLRLTAGLGYRFTGSGWYGRHDDDRYRYTGDTRLNGAVGSIGLQIGGGS